MTKVAEIERFRRSNKGGVRDAEALGRTPGSLDEYATTMKTARALIVQPILEDADRWSAVAASLGFHVTVARRFAHAKSVLATGPHLLITDVRLHDYNGLHLVLRATFGSTRLAALVTSRTEDAVLQLEAEKLGATWVLMPNDPIELSAAVIRAMVRHGSSGDPTLRPPFERRHAQRRSEMIVAPDDRRVAERRRRSADVIQLSI
jgi:DNA-binding response OmpR family regulator